MNKAVSKLWGGPGGFASGRCKAKGTNVSDIPVRVRKIIADHLKTEPEKFTDAADLIEDLGADSLDAIELAMTLEEEFVIDVPDEDWRQFHTVSDIVKYVESKVK